jgi:anti-anti-sigma factor
MSVEEQDEVGALRASGGRTPAWYLGVETRRTGAGAIVCRLSGDLDLGSSPPVRAALADGLAAKPARLIVDLSAVDFCDSSGLNLLLQLRLDAEAAGVPVYLAAPTSSVLRVLEVTGAAAVFSVHASVSAADRA